MAVVTPDGRLRAQALYAGRGVDRIGDVEPAGERVRRIAEEAALALHPADAP